MKPKLSDLWRWDGELNRSTFLFWGILLATIKFNLDRLILSHWLAAPWTLFHWETLQFYLWQSPLQQSDQTRLLALLTTSLPFLWFGTILILRRLRSLGWRPAWVLLFFVPVAKLVFFAVLCILPSRPASTSISPVTHPNSRLRNLFPQGKWISAFSAVALTSAFAIVATWTGVNAFKNYGWTIFVGLPFSMGFLATLLDSLHEPRTLRRCISVANAAILLAGIGLLLFAIEGIFCLLMAAPLAFAIATMGGILGYAIQRGLRWQSESPKLFCSILALIPASLGLEHFIPPPIPLLEVKTSVTIHAPVEQVWKNVVSFSELPPPSETIFKLGVAYPIRADIQGTGVGAIRHCQFSTGPFVEPIEVWDQPRLLRFSVTANPQPMQEWTPYKHIHPPHLEGYLESRQGQFLLTPLTDGRTLLEGTTWYHHHLWPADYWQLWSDRIIHTIHLRVLNHVKALSERAPH